MKLIPLILLILLSFNVSAQSNAYSIGEKHTLYSEILKQEREVYVHLPAGFFGMDENLESYPVTFVLDGESQFLSTVSAIDYLSSAPLGNDVMPRTIVVGIPSINRNLDFTPYKGIIAGDKNSLEFTGGGPKFLDFIVSELTPFLDSLYSTNRHRTIIGHSLGGLLVFEALLNKREHFNNYLALDPALDFDGNSYYNQIIDSLDTANLSEENLFIGRPNTLLDFLSPEEIAADDSEILKLPKANQKFFDLAENANWKLNIHCKYYPEENHFSIPYPATYDAMKYFYSYYYFKEMAYYYHPDYRAKTDLIDRLKKHYQNISKQLGYKVKPMEGFINSWAWGMGHFQRPDLAIEMFDLNIKLYPDHASVYNSKGYFLINQNREKEAIVLFEKSLELEEDAGIREVLEGMR